MLNGMKKKEDLRGRAGAWCGVCVNVDKQRGTIQEKNIFGTVFGYFRPDNTNTIELSSSVSLLRGQLYLLSGTTDLLKVWLCRSGLRPQERQTW
jgi:hypothetical protein